MVWLESTKAGRFLSLGDISKRKVNDYNIALIVRWIDARHSNESQR